MSRTIEEVRGYLRAKVNDVLRRLGVYGDEVSLILLFDALAYADGIESDWAAERAGLRERGWFVSTGVRGAIECVLPDIGRGDSAIASVYAEFAHRVGWLALDRVLTDGEYSELRSVLPTWCEQDRAMSEVTHAFGLPSALLGPTSVLHSKTLLYVADGRSIACFGSTACFHLWNGLTEPGLQSRFDEPVLLAARIGDLAIDEAMAFTPAGLLRRPEGA